MNNSLVRIAIVVGFIIGAWIGSHFAHGMWFAWQSVVGGVIGLIAGVVIVYRWMQS